MNKLTQISTYIKQNDPVLDAIEQDCKATGLSRSDLVRQILLTHYKAQLATWRNLNIEQTPAPTPITS